MNRDVFKRRKILNSLPSPLGPVAVKVASSEIEGANKRVRDTHDKKRC